MSKKIPIKSNDLFAYYLSLIYIIAGSVNTGQFSFFPALPFFYYTIAFTNIYKKYKSITTITLLLSFVLIILKFNDSKIFYPQVGRQIFNAEQLCVQEIADSNGGKSYISVNKSCSSAIFLKNLLIPKNTKFEIKKTSSYRSFGNLLHDIYSIEIETPLGLGTGFLDDFSYVNNNHPLKDEDMYRPIFYLLSIPIEFMMWFPFVIFIMIYIGRLNRKKESDKKEAERLSRLNNHTM